MRFFRRLAEFELKGIVLVDAWMKSPVVNFRKFGLCFFF
jgi:hypothetical protein